MTRPTAYALPIVLCLVSVGLMTVMNALFKALPGGYSLFQVALLRYVFGAIWIGALVAWRRPAWPARTTLPAHFLRGALGMISGTSFFFALRDLSLADSFTITFLAPLFVAILSMLMLRERPRPADLMALALGFCGMLVVVGAFDGKPASRSLFGVGCAALSAITYALTLVMLRKMAQRDSGMVLVLFQHVVSAVLLVPVGLYVWTAMEPAHVAIIAGASVIGVIGHLMVARAYSALPAARLAPLDYASLVYAAGIDFVWFGTGLARETVLGAALIIVAALLTSRR